MSVEAHPLQSVSCDVRLHDHFLCPSHLVFQSFVGIPVLGMLVTKPFCGETGEEVITKYLVRALCRLGMAQPIQFFVSTSSPLLRGGVTISIVSRECISQELRLCLNEG